MLSGTRYAQNYASIIGWSVQAKNNVRGAPVGSALTLVSHRSHKARTINCRHLHTKGERQRRTKLSFGRAMMQALELLRLAKRHIWG